MAVSLRTSLLLPLDDLLAVVREFLNLDASRSGLDRCLRRHGVSNLRDLRAKAPRPAHKPFKAYEPGFMHIDVKYLPHRQTAIDLIAQAVTAGARRFKACTEIGGQ